MPKAPFLPLVLVLKDKDTKPKFSEDLLLGSDVFMNLKSSHINVELFLNWIKNHFIPRMSEGKVLLILEGHYAHSNLYEMLPLSRQNDVTILCLPSHTTQALQPLEMFF